MRRLKKILLVLLAGGLAVIIGLYLYVFVFGGLERMLDDLFARVLDPRYHLELSVGRIRGNFVSGFTAENVTAFYKDSTHRYPLVTVPRLSAAYSIANIWNRNYVLDHLYIDSAVIAVERDTAGDYLLPNLASAGAPAGETTTPSAAIKDLRLDNVTFRLIKKGGDTLAVEDITLRASISAEEATYGIAVSHFEFTSNAERIVLDAADGKLTYSKGLLLFQDMTVKSREARLKLSGNLGFGAKPFGSVAFAIDNLDLKDVTRYIGPPLTGVLDVDGSLSFEGARIRGTVDLGGDFVMASFKNLSVSFRFQESHLYLDSLYGTILDDCALDGRGEVDFSSSPETYHLDAQLRNFNLKHLIKNAFESDLNGAIVLDGESFRHKTLKLRLHTELYESTFDGYPLQQALGDLLITPDSVVFLDSFQVKYFENVFWASGRIEYSHEMALNVWAQLGNLDRYRGKLFIDQPGGRGHAEARLFGPTANPDLAGSFSSDSVWIYGLYSSDFRGDFQLKRFLTGRRGEVKVKCLAGTAWDVPYDSGRAALRVDSNLVFFDSTTFIGRYADLYGRGVADVGAYPRKLDFDALTVTTFDQRFENRGPVQIEIDSAGFDFKKAAIGGQGAGVSLLGRINYDQSMDARLSLEHVVAAPWLNLTEKSWPFNGSLSCDVTLAGTFLEPRFSFAGSLDSLTYRDLVLGNLTAHLSYQNRLVSIDSLVVRSNPGEYRVDGSLHLDLAFTTDSRERLLDLPMDVHLTAHDTRFDLVSLVMPSVEQLEGDFAADVRLSGTPFEPHLEGGAYIKKARLKYLDLAQTLYADSASVAMKDNKIIVGGIEAYALDKKQKRYAHVEGELTVKSFDSLHYDLDINLPKEFPFSYELEDIKGTVEGELHVEGYTPPLVTGDLTLLSTRYEVNFAKADEGSPLMAALTGENSWDLNLNVDILSNYWIKNDDIDAEFSGQINLIREHGNYRFIGEMDILRGKGFLFDKTFTLEPGSKVVFEGTETLNPTLDITGHTTITTSSTSLVQEVKSYDQLNVGVHVTGTLENPEINPTEDSDVQNREELLPLIVANYYSTDKGSATSGIEQRLTGLISSQVSQIGSRKLSRLGVETFEIDPYYQGQIDLAKTRVTLGFYTAPNLYVYGRSALSGQTGQEVGFEYRFYKNVVFEGRRDENELYRLLVKLHWEF